MLELKKKCLAPLLEKWIAMVDNMHILIKKSTLIRKSNISQTVYQRSLISYKSSFKIQ